MVVINIDTTLTSIFTLEEKRTLLNPYYLFVFSNSTTGDEVKFIKFYGDDVSDYPDRFNEFNIDTALFDSAPLGQYNYSVYEQLSSNNTDITGLSEVECGKMELKSNTATVRNGYTQTNTAKGYGG